MKKDQEPGGKWYGLSGVPLVHSGLRGEQLAGGFSCAFLPREWVQLPTGSWTALRAWCQQALISQPGPKFGCICCQGSGLSGDQRGILEWRSVVRVGRMWEQQNLSRRSVKDRKWQREVIYSWKSRKIKKCIWTRIQQHEGQGNRLCQARDQRQKKSKCRGNTKFNEPGYGGLENGRVERTWAESWVGPMRLCKALRGKSRESD